MLPSTLMLRRSCGVVIVCLAAAGTGCQRSEPITVHAAEPAWPARKLHLQFAHRWPSLSSPGRIDAAATGQGTARAGESVAVAFLDLDGNGRVSLFDEPSALCPRNAPWDCTLTALLLNVRRIQGLALTPGAASLRDSAGEKRKPDIVRIELDAHDTQTGAPDETAKVCQGEVCAGRTRGSAEETPSPLGACAPGSLAKIELRVSTSRLPQTVVEAETPHSLGFQASVTAESGKLLVQGTAIRPVDLAVGWIRVMRQGMPDAILWSSERHPDALQVSRDGKTVSVSFPDPRALCGSMETCVFGLQVAALQRQMLGIPTVLTSEAAAVGLASEAPRS